MRELMPYGATPLEQPGDPTFPLDLSDQEMIQGVCLSLAQEHRDGFVPLLEQWFADRDEVVLLASCTSVKAGQGLLILEWEGGPIDPLFLAIVRQEPLIDDYWVYTRSREA